MVFRDLLVKDDKCVICDLTPLEFWATVRRKESEGVLAPGEALKVQTALEADLADEAILMKTCDAAVKGRGRSFLTDASDILTFTAHGPATTNPI